MKIIRQIELGPRYNDILSYHYWHFPFLLFLDLCSKIMRKKIQTEPFPARDGIRSASEVIVHNINGGREPETVCVCVLSSYSHDTVKSVTLEDSREPHG